MFRHGSLRRLLRQRLALALFIAPALLSACSGGATPGTLGEDLGVVGDGAMDRDANADGGVDSGMLAPEIVALLEIHALDLWAQPLLASESSLAITRDGAAVPVAGWPVVSIPLTTATTYQVALTADAHEPLMVGVTFDGSSALDGAILQTGSSAVGAGVSMSHDTRTVLGRELPVHVVYLGLRHLWFSAEGRPARRGNDVRLMTSGEEAWGAVADDLRASTDRVHMSTWWWESTFELERDAATHVSSSMAERQSNTILGVLDGLAATKRILVGQFISQDGVLDWVTTDSALRARGAAIGDDFEFMGQANVTRGMFYFEIPAFDYVDKLLAQQPSFADRSFDPESPIESTIAPRDVDLTDWPISLDVAGASYHQKFATVDGRIAFVGGMNLRPVDWDTDAHEVFEPRRMAIDATTAERLAVADGDALPDSGPRKDFMTRIEGPVVQDVDEVFQIRWETQLDSSVMYAENATPFEIVRDQPVFPDGVQAQITATLPQPYWEHAIAESWFNAVANAERYIFIEDQYFRVPMLVDLIIERMNEIPSLELVVITKPVNEYTDPGCEWSYRTTEELSTRFPTRYHLFELRSFDTEVTFGFDETEERFTSIDVHSKMLIVDDVFLSVGSANKNNRGIVYEGELNVAVYDATWVREQRRRILALILPPGVTPADGTTAWVTQLETAAAANQAVWNNWDAEGGDISLDGDPLPAAYRPAGFIYPLGFRETRFCLLKGIGPDMT